MKHGIITRNTETLDRVKRWKCFKRYKMINYDTQVGYLFETKNNSRRKQIIKAIKKELKHNDKRPNYISSQIR